MCICCAGSIAAAQPLGSDRAEEPTTPEAASEAPEESEAEPPPSDLPEAQEREEPQAIEVQDDPALRLFQEAVADSEQGRLDDARRGLQFLLRDYPEHRSARAARLLSAHIESQLEAEIAALAYPEQKLDSWFGLDPYRAERPSKMAARELALVQGVHGLFFGFELGEALGDEDLGALLGLAGLGAGIAWPLIAGGDEGLRPGTRALVNSGTGWGIYNGAILAEALELPSNPGQPSAAKMLVAAQGLGTVGGLLLDSFRITEGQVAMANSVGIWSALYAQILWDATRDDEYVSYEMTDQQRKGYATTMLLAGNGGFMFGGLLSRYYRMTRGRSLLIDGGGFMGMLGGLATAALIDDEFSTQTGATVLIMGSAAGMAAATLLTRDWDLRLPDANIAVVPTSGGFTTSLQMNWEP